MFAFWRLFPDLLYGGLEKLENFQKKSSFPRIALDTILLKLKIGSQGAVKTHLPQSKVMQFLSLVKLKLKIYLLQHFDKLLHIEILGQ